MSARFIMAGGGTGGHVIPALAVARVLAARGHQPVFIGTERGLEAKLVPAAGFPIEWIEIGGLKRVGWRSAVKTLRMIPGSVRRALAHLDQRRPAAVFSMGGYVAAPVMLAAIRRRIPIVVMEPNAMPGLVNRRLGRFVARALLSFPEAERYFPRGRSEITGVPVRPEFFQVPPKPRGDSLTLLITGGSQGSRTLNRAAQQSWPLFRESRFRVRFLHQTGIAEHEEIARQFAQSGMEGEVTPFISDMPAAFAAADMVICRSGANTVAEIAASGKPSILVPFPFAADNHQLRNAEALANAGAARVVADSEMNGRRLFDEVTSLASRPGALDELGAAVRRFARPRAAERAADVLEEFAHGEQR
ncbi:MAG TPA: undecaprenyldiphospho-muramoylpentapeptide beta-N-acetylglucosaminyltransferase [Bryobacteraceae bacterium]|nr:undecaprenyldiphospho-muramoylpentapeptide beta-N-acetylglucosaminyltransferase [Bryobacteraceae bacterium]